MLGTPDVDQQLARADAATARANATLARSTAARWKLQLQAQAVSQQDYDDRQGAADVADIRIGRPASLALPERPGQRFAGTLVRTAGAIDPTSRTLRVEVDVDSAPHRLFPGACTQVHFHLPTAGGGFILPANTLLFRGDHLQVAAAVNGTRAQLIEVSVGKDYGGKVQIVHGLKGDERVIVNPPDSIADGETVQVRGAPGKKSVAGA